MRRLEAEDLGFEQRVGNRRAVDVHERGLRTWAHLVNHARDETLARARFTLDEHRRQPLQRGGRVCEQTRQLVPYGGQRRARAEQLMQHVTILSNTLSAFERWSPCDK